jgi:hypothetical protein
MVLTVDNLYGLTSSIYACLRARNGNSSEEMVVNLLPAEYKEQLPLQKNAYL